MKTYIIILLFFISTISYSQDSLLRAYLKHSSTFENYRGNYYYRIWTNNQIVDLWLADSSDYFPLTPTCNVLNWTIEVLDKSDKNTPFTYIQSVSYYTLAAKNLIKVLDSLKVDTFPSYESIVGWRKNAVHNDVFKIEYIHNGIYNLKSFPGYNFNIENSYGALINTLMTRMNEILKLSDSRKEFIEAIPVECYQNLDVWSTCKAMTKQDRKILNKEREQFSGQSSLGHIKRYN